MDSPRWQHWSRQKASAFVSMGKNATVTKHYNLFFSEDIMKVIEDRSHFNIWLVSSGSTVVKNTGQGFESSGLYYKHTMIVNDNSIMMLQVVASPTIIILTTLEVSFLLLANNYIRGITQDNCHVMIVIYIKYRPQVSLLAVAATKLAK